MEPYGTSVLILVLLASVDYAILYIGNYSIEDRYKQYWIPVTFAGLSLILWILWFFFHVEISKGFLLKIPKITFPAELSSASLNFLYVLIGILLFSILKLGMKFWNKKRNTKPPAELAYVLNKNYVYGLRSKWATAVVISRSLFVVLAILSLISILGIFILYPLLKTSILPAESNWLPGSGFSLLGLLLALEMKWYLKSNLEYVPETSPNQDLKQAQEDNDSIGKKIEDLRTAYKEIWEPFLLIDYYKAYPEEEYRIPLQEDLAIPLSREQGNWVREEQIHLRKEIENGEDLIVKKVIYEEFSQILFSVLANRLKTGDNILFILPWKYQDRTEYFDKIKSWIGRWIARLGGEGFEIEYFEKRTLINSQILLAFAEELLTGNLKEKKNASWCSNVSTMVILEGNEVFVKSINSLNVISHIFHSFQPDIQTIIFTDQQHDIEPAITGNLKLRNDHKVRDLAHFPPKHCYCMVWKMEGEESLQSPLTTAHVYSHLGEETILGLLPWSKMQDDPLLEEDLPPLLVNHDLLPLDEYMADIEKRKNSEVFNTKLIDLKKKQDVFMEYFQMPPIPYLIEKKKQILLYLRDTRFNFVAAFDKWKDYGDAYAYVHIVTSPYLLRDYFAHNFEYFAKNPIRPLAPKMMLSKFQYAIRLLYRLAQQEMREGEILEGLNNIGIETKNVKETLIDLFAEAFQLDLKRKSYLSHKNVIYFDHEKNTKFKREPSFGLSSGIREDARLAFLEKIEIQDTRGNNLATISKDFLYQNYLPGQTHAFLKKPYKIFKFQESSKILTVNKVKPKKQICYRPDLTVDLYQTKGGATSNNRIRSYRAHLVEDRFAVKTKGYFSFTNNLSYEFENHNYIDLQSQNIPVRDYRLGRYLQIYLGKSAVEKQLSDGYEMKLLITLTVLLKEISYTLFPYAYQYLIFGLDESSLSKLEKKLRSSKQSAENEVDSNIPVEPICSSLPITAVNFINETEKESSSSVSPYCIYIFEDANQDLGLIQSFHDNIQYIFSILSDYLTWLNEAASIDEGSSKDRSFVPENFDKLDFLKYGCEELSPYLDIEHTKILMDQILRDTRISKKRKAFYRIG